MPPKRKLDKSDSSQQTTPMEQDLPTYDPSDKKKKADLRIITEVGFFWVFSEKIKLLDFFAKGLSPLWNKGNSNDFNTKVEVSYDEFKLLMDFVHEKTTKLTISDVETLLDLFDKYIASESLKKDLQKQINTMVDSLPIEKVILLQELAEKHRLQEINLEDVIKFRLAENVFSNFSCKGIVQDKTTTICFHDGDTAHLIEFPKPDQNKLQTLISMCKPASFGRGKEEIQDPKYRKAHALDTNHFLSSFHPADHGILKIIENIMHSTSAVHAELYKLNIYSKGGHFKEHVDTPRASNMIGSLVVCLPCEHTGGSLIVKHEGKEIEFDFSGNSKDIQWCAFYADCVHQVMPVNEGHRVTLTYNLYSQKPLDTLKIEETEVYKALKASMHPSVHPKGVILGFHCKHTYTNDSFGRTVDLANILKGGDALVYAAAKSLNLSISLQSVWDPPESYDDDDDDGEKDEDEDMVEEEQRYNPFGYDQRRKKIKFEKGKLLINENPPGTQVGDDFCIDDECTESDFFQHLGSKAVDVVWLGERKSKYIGAVAATYGNEPSSSVFYCTAALIVQIGPKDNRRIKEQKKASKKKKDYY